MLNSFLSCIYDEKHWCIHPEMPLSFILPMSPMSSEAYALDKDAFVCSHNSTPRPSVEETEELKITTLQNSPGVVKPP